VFRVLISRRWLGAMAVALAFGVAAFFLGQWQWHRYEAKAANAARINSHYSATPHPVTQVLSPAPLSLTQEWTRVTMHGHYVVQDTMVVRNRPHAAGSSTPRTPPRSPTSRPLRPGR
jgi:cytochrome oxidase assembly protein ShyY1